MRLDDDNVRRRVEQVDTLLARVQALPPGEARSVAIGLLEALLDLYGEGLARIVGAVTVDGGELAGRLAEDELVGHLLLLHGLHPAQPEVPAGAGEPALIPVSGLFRRAGVP